MKRNVRVLPLVLFAVCSTVDGRQSTEALIGGQVIDADTASPVAGAAVALLDDSGRSRSVTTDMQGRFAFPDLREGTFSIIAAKTGWIEGAYGRRRPNGSLQTILVRPHQRLEDLEVRMWRFGTISGTVFSDTSLPVSGVEVRALRRTVAGGS
jgi:Carboxypeptidase regulatory-like domain